MELEEIRDAFLVLHGEVTELLSEVRHTRFQWTLIIRPRQLRKMENRFDALSQRFALLDTELIQHSKLPKDHDLAVRTTGTFNLYAAVREAVHGLLSDTTAALGSLRTQVNLHRSLAVSVIGVLVTVVLVAAIVMMLL